MRQNLIKNKDCADQIGEQGVDANLRDGDGATPLHFAASRGHSDAVRWLLVHGAKLVLDQFGKSPINDAAENQQMECLNILVQHGTVPDYNDEAPRGCTCKITDPQSRCLRGDCVNFSREPFYLHAPSSAQPQDGLYINPMTQPSLKDASLTSSGCSSVASDPFYLHNPQQVIYNRVKDLFETSSSSGVGTSPPPPPPPLNALTVTVDVHSNSGPPSDDNPCYSDLSERSGDNDYEDIYAVREQAANHQNNAVNHNNVAVNNSVNKMAPRRNSRDSGSHSRSTSISSTGSHRGSTQGHVKVGSHATSLTTDGAQEEQGSLTMTTESGVSSGSPSDLGGSEEESESTKAKVSLTQRRSLPPAPPDARPLKRLSSEPARGPPPPPPPPPAEEAPLSPPTPHTRATMPLQHSPPAAARSRLETDSTPVQVEGGETDQGETRAAGLVNRQMVLPFILPKFVSTSDSDALIKPSEYLRSLGGARPHVLVQPTAQEVQPAAPALKQPQPMIPVAPALHSHSADSVDANVPPPPPLPAPGSDMDASCHHPPAVGEIKTDSNNNNNNNNNKQQQPLGAISIHDLNSVQLRRTDKMLASKTLSAPPGSGYHMTRTQGKPDQPFMVQKTDLIAELKMSRDITGIKKMKVERAKVEEREEKELYTEITKVLTVDSFVEQIPDKDPTGNPIPPWKRQMLAKKAADKARKEMEEQKKKEAEDKRLMSIPAWKRQLLAKKEEQDTRKPQVYTPRVVEEKRIVMPASNGTTVITINGDSNNNNVNNKENHEVSVNIVPVMQVQEPESEDELAPVMPWRSQLRKTNSTLNLLE